MMKNGSLVQERKRPGTEKRLELIRTIRMQNQQNRQLCNSRVQMLYGEPQKRTVQEHAELYGLEEENGSPRAEIRGNQAEGRGFRLRLLAAAVLLTAFVVCDRQHISYHGENTDTLFRKMTQNIEVTGLQGFLPARIIEEVT